MALALATVVVAGCDKAAPPSPVGPAPSTPVSPTTMPATVAATTAATPEATGTATAAGPREVVNPDNTTMVFLYHELAGLKPPVDDWVEKDNRVQFAPAPDKAAQRTRVRAEFEAGVAAARGIGRIRLSLANAELSDYDPANGEFIVRALSPASEIGFQALGEKIATRFANGETAQLWRVPQAEAQLVRDRIGRQQVSLDVLLKVSGVQPGPGGGAIVTEIEEYTLRSADGSTLARIKPGAS